MADKQPVPKDPVQTRSLSMPLFIASAVLMASVVLAGYDEFVGRRPYKQYQRNFLTVYLNYLDELLPAQEKKLDEIMQSAEYTELVARKEQAEARLEAAAPEIDAELDRIAADTAALQAVFKSARSLHSALRYQLETARTERAKEKIRSEMEAVKQQVHPVTLGTDGAEEQLELKYEEIEARLRRLSAEKAEKERHRGDLSRPVSDVKKQIDAYVRKHLNGPTPEAVRKLVTKAEAGQVGPEGKPVEDILQIHVGEMGWEMEWIDRCESCHAGTREPVFMTVEDIERTTEVGLNPDETVVYTAHPNKKLLEIHNPDKFGCSMCHNGNGISVSDVELAHGLNKHWLYPLHERENFEAGCVQCHTDDLELEHAETLSRGKWLFYWKGCWGCHKYGGYDPQESELQDVANEINGVSSEHDRLSVQRGLEKEVTAKQLIDMRMSGLETRLSELERLQADLTKERQKVAPDLANVRAKIKRDWLVPWLLDPTAFRPTTKMPTFFQNVDPELAEQHATKIAAYIWQHAGDRTVQRYRRGDVARGKELFRSRGCLGCHTITEDGERMGDGFAADLSRIGEKNNYDFVVSWILEPDSGVMPNLRLTVEDAQHLATYLTSLTTGRTYAPTPQLEDENLAREGLKLIRHYGCSGCHAIPGTEKDGRIGTELTNEGSKPKERLDFGRLEHGFKMEGRYRHKDFFEQKLAYPGVFGIGRVFEDPEGLDRLKMPNFRLEEDDITALTTMLLGSIDSEIPESFRYHPDERRKAIQEGWWVVRKYNCVGCHQIEPGVEPNLWSLPMYQGQTDEGVKRSDLHPPSLVGFGFRSNPDWLAEFLRNPALQRKDIHRNGLRNYLDIRMPTFRLSEREIQKIVAFFGALDSQPVPYIPPELTPLSDTELRIARDLFKGVKCVNCHMTGDPVRDAKMNAPPLTEVGAKLKPAWTKRWLIDPQRLLPGTSMPQNFVYEYRVALTGGREIVGTDLNVPTRGQARIKRTSDGQYERFSPDDIVRTEVVRTLGTKIPESGRDFEGDYADLMVRYLHLHYDEAEIPRSMPDE